MTDPVTVPIAAAGAGRHVRDGRARIAALELKKVHIDRADLATLDLKGKRFDCITCLTNARLLG
jgi:hypothetical protein